jgi:hypothetical protein
MNLVGFNNPTANSHFIDANALTQGVANVEWHNMRIVEQVVDCLAEVAVELVDGLDLPVARMDCAINAAPIE